MTHIYFIRYSLCFLTSGYTGLFRSSSSYVGNVTAALAAMSLFILKILSTSPSYHLIHPLYFSPNQHAFNAMVRYVNYLCALCGKLDQDPSVPFGKGQYRIRG